MKKNLGKNRDRLRIIAAILEASRTGASKTHIMFAANLSFKLLEKYLTITTQAGFIQLQDSNYRLTSLGQDFLERYRAFYTEYSKLQASLQALVNEQEKLERQCIKNVLCTQSPILEGKL